ncbi:MAG: hypothetical protein C9356_15235 [Oleiphilus sp.]|nr:MAG: hypothetical protein C9356_15235 [Oleiphilus sp.]
MVKISVNAKGQFYTNCPDILRDSVKSVVDGSEFYFGHRGETVQLFASSLDRLVEGIRASIKTLLSPEVTERIVIRYNIESHVSFAEAPGGQIFPNAGYPGAEWPSLESKEQLYGGHHATNPSKNGYSLVIGAKAFRKVTYRYGKSEKVKYEYYTETEDAQRLNDWTSFSLPESAGEIAYTDEAARFFHNLMLGMAELSRKIQYFAGDQDKLLSVIESQQALLPQ